MDRRRLEVLGVRFLVTLFAALLLLGVVEVGCRAVCHDFDKAAKVALPPGYVSPDHVDRTVLRKRGPKTWRGQPLRARCRYLRLDDAELRAEPEIEVTHDRQGFRNPEGLADWRIAVAGDGLTEQGDLATEDLFTTQLAAQLGAPVKNLGCAGSGTGFHLEYLRRWGVAPSCRTWVVVFNEADDLEQLPPEELHRSGIRRMNPDHIPRHSATLELLQLVHTTFFAPPSEPHNGYLVGDGGVDVPVKMCHSPPSPQHLSGPMQAMFEASLAMYGQHAAAAGVEPWLAYMPAKERIFHALGHIELIAPPSQIANWRPNELPGWVAAACARAGIRFVDLTPDLLAHASARRPDRGFEEVHGHSLTRAGSRCVAATLTRTLGASR